MPRVEKNKSQKKTCPHFRVSPMAIVKSFLIFGILLPAVALLAMIKFSFDAVPTSQAAQTYVQLASGQSRFSRLVQANWLKAPTPGNLLVAVVSNSHATEIEAPVGWLEAINESQFTPGQSVFYKIASQKEDHVVTVGRISQRVNLGLQIFEYSGIDSANPIDAVASSVGQGQIIHSGTLKTSSDKSLLLALVTVARKENFGGLWDNNFFLRNFGQTKGDGLISFSMADLTTVNSGQFDTALALGGQAKWRGQIVAFHRFDQTLTQAIDEAPADVAILINVDDPNPEPGGQVTYTVVAQNNGVQDLNNIFVQSHLPQGVFLKQADFSQGRYAPGVGMWEVGDLAQGQVASLHLRAYVDEHAFDQSIITKASLYIVEQTDRQKENNEAFAIIDIQNTSGIRRECPEITNVDYHLAQEQASTDIRNVSVQASATGADYVLLSEVPNRKYGTYHALSSNLEYELSPEPGEKTVYAWFMNFCQSSGIAKDSIEYVPAQVVVEDIEIIETGFEENVATNDLSVVSEEEQKDENQATAISESDDVVSVTAMVKKPVGACGITYQFLHYLMPEDVNSEVRRLQEVLICLGYFPLNQASTAIFGPVTQQAVKDFQSAHGIEPVGYVGPSTVKTLNQYTQQ